MPNLRRFSLYAVLLLTVLLLASCGRKTAPVPPGAAIPAPIEDLAYQFDGKGVILEWTYPQQSIDGEEIEKVRYFILNKSDLADEEYCPDCPATVTSVQKIHPGSVRLGRKIRIRDPHLVSGHHYSYTVIAHCGWNITSRESNRISFWWDTPPAAPSSVRIKENGQQDLTVRWDPVTKDSNGAPLDQPLQYQIFRRSTDGKFVLQGKTTGKTTYNDQKTEGEKYVYRIRAVNVYKGTAIPGQYSRQVSFTPADRNPPPVPEIISVMESRQGPRLLWERVSAPDLAGYRVYRRSSNVAEWSLIVETGPNAFSFIDEALSDKKGTWHYSLTSIDSASPANESHFSPEKIYQSGE